MKYARYTKETGEIEGLYDTAVHTSIPSRTVEITDEEWSAIVSNPGKYMIDTRTATLVEKSHLTMSEIAAYRLMGQEKVDHAAEAVRRTYLTLTVGQDTIYMWKYQEAVEFARVGTDDHIDDYPLIAADYDAFADAGINKTPHEVANDIIAKHTEARTTAAALEKIRRSAKERIARMNKREDIDLVVQNALTQMENM